MLNQLTGYGQIQVGDVIRCEYKGKAVTYLAEEVLHPGTDKEEVIIDKKQNKYFITSMALYGRSWAKNVQFLRPTNLDLKD